MPPLAIEAILTVVMQIIGWGIRKMANTEERKQALELFGELARVMNIRGITKRLEAEKQLKAGSVKWDEIEAAEKAKKEGNK